MATISVEGCESREEEEALIEAAKNDQTPLTPLLIISRRRTWTEEDLKPGGDFWVAEPHNNGRICVTLEPGLTPEELGFLRHVLSNKRYGDQSVAWESMAFPLADGGWRGVKRRRPPRRPSDL